VEAELRGTLLQRHGFAAVRAPPVLGRSQVPVAQADNVHVFPAVGPAAVACRATRVTDRMMVAVAKAAVEDGVAPEATEAELRAAASATRWTPRYA
jgi:malate dehydrogenase (oxaloacetate-decarboxylating)